MAAKPAVARARADARPNQPNAEALAERRARLDAILRAILADPEAGFRAIGVLYQDFLVRCRIEGIGAAAPDLQAFRRMLTHARAGIGAEAAEEDAAWQEVAARGAALPEDMQGIFLMIARAARDGPPCPTDGALARAYGTRSSAPGTTPAGVYGGTGPHRLPDGWRRPADRDVGGTGLGDGAGLPERR